MSLLISIFASDLLVRILTLFILHPDRGFYQAEINEKTKGTLRNTQQMLAKLEKAGLITSKRQGRMVFYQANTRHPGFNDLKTLLIKTVAIGDVVRHALEPYQDRVQMAFIFGSFARGEETVESDLDLCVVGEVGLKELSEALATVQESIGREVNLVDYTAKTFKQRLKEKNRFVQELLSCPKIWLIGTEDDLATMA